MYINLYINPRFCTNTLHRREGHFFLVYFQISFLNLLKDVEHFTFLDTKFQIWAPKEVIVSVPYRKVFKFLRSRLTSLQKLYWRFLILNTSFIIYGAILLKTLNISAANVCKLHWWIVAELSFSKSWQNNDLNLL